MTDHSKPSRWDCPACGTIFSDPKMLKFSLSVTCACEIEMIPCFTPLDTPEPSVIHDMAELEVVTVPPTGPWAVSTWFMSSDAYCGRSGARGASAFWDLESDIPRIAKTSARLREEDQ